MNRIFHILLSFFLLLILADCAKIGAPVGGPRDKSPPVIEKSKPLNYSVNYDDNKFEITFDEYIKTAAIGQEMVVSPPLEERPEVRLRGKTLVIEWFEELRDSTTYTFSFGESIQDLNEGNVLLNFEFVFSTGGHLDSLAVLGSVLKAFDLQPLEEKVFLLLYSDMADSAPLKDLPDYVGLADEKGNFLINNLRADTYKLFALQDLNRNYKYDVPEEFIGFVDSAFLLLSSMFDSIPGDETGSSEENVEMGLRPDSAWLAMEYMMALAHGDSITLSADDSLVLGLFDTLDMILVDSTLLEEDDSITLADLAPWSIFVDVSIFQEDNSQQYLVENTRKDRRWFTMRFNKRVEDTVLLEPFDFEPEGDWYIFEKHVMNDTFVYWITDSLIYKRDSLTMLATYLASDSLLNMVPFYDTLKFNYREPAKKEVRTRRRDKDAVGDDTEWLTITAGPEGGREQDIYRPMPIISQHPVLEIDTSRINLVKIEDTLEIAVPYSLDHDKVKLRRYLLNVDWEGITTYKLDIYPGAFTDIYGLTNDTINLRFRTKDPEYYSRILLNLSGVRGQKIIQVLDKGQKVIRSKIVREDGIVEFDYMEPAGFILKLIHDSNEDGEWNTGDYLEHIQPETVEYSEGTLTLRSNFDLEVNWEIENPVSETEEGASGDENEGVSEEEPVPEGTEIIEGGL
ncbi:MAG TPA: hypothetical protein ENI20_17660 [Bacteroides sp.]|nr:hypothetical protein [Bacteroides sp.]